MPGREKKSKKENKRKRKVQPKQNSKLPSSLDVFVSFSQFVPTLPLIHPFYFYFLCYAFLLSCHFSLRRQSPHMNIYFFLLHGPSTLAIMSVKSREQRKIRTRKKNNKK
ncbi:hypothetical protein DFJ73DRAFT_824211 [Zopfochytrium polystomum]|nr:hypothetical protein DFJ73DRAFT_824211 [Zopfochytrium polystomum]